MVENEDKPASFGWISRLSEISVLVWVPLLLCFWIFIQLSLIVYSVYFGPLSDIPGPKFAALTDLYESYSAGYRPDFYWRDVQELHKRYGPIVRISPNEIHLDDVGFSEGIYPTIKDLDKDRKSGGLLLRRDVQGSAARRLHRRVGNNVSSQNTRNKAASHDTETLWQMMWEFSRRKEAVLSTVVSKALARNIGAITDETVTVIENVLHHVFHNHTVLHKIETELESVELADHALLDDEKLDQLPYLSAVISESLRLSIPMCVTEITTVLDTDMIYKEIIIPTGVTISMTLADVHFDQQYFPAPRTFHPERWIGPDVILSREFDPKHCLGMLDLEPMYTELLLVIGAVIMHFNIDFVELADEQEASYEETLLLSHSGDLPVGLRARKKRS